MKNFYIDSFQLHDNQTSIGYALQIPIEGLQMPDIRFASVPRAGEHGALMANQLYDARLIILKGKIYGDTVGEYNLRRRALQNAIRILKDSNTFPIAKTLSFTTMDDLALQVKGYLYAQPKIPMANLTVGDFEITFYCPEYYLESQNTQVKNILTPFGGGFTLPVIFPISFEVEQGGNTVLNNAGDAEYYPTITLKGLLTNPILYNTTINKYIALNLTISTGDINNVVIDMRNKTILQNGTPIMNDLITGSSWWWLEAGDNNISLTTSSSSDTGEMDVSYKESFIGA